MKREERARRESQSLLGNEVIMVQADQQPPRISTGAPVCPSAQKRVVCSPISPPMPPFITTGVMYGRRPRCKRNLTISEAFGCGHVFGL